MHRGRQRGTLPAKPCAAAQKGATAVPVARRPTEWSPYHLPPAVPPLRQCDYARVRVRFEEGLVLFRELGERPNIGYALEGFARLAVAQGLPQHGAQLWAAAGALRQALGAPREPGGQAEYEQALVVLRAALGEEIYAAA